jgi:hypothetical protein
MPLVVVPCLTALDSRGRISCMIPCTPSSRVPDVHGDVRDPGEKLTPALLNRISSRPCAAIGASASSDNRRTQCDLRGRAPGAKSHRAAWLNEQAAETLPHQCQPRGAVVRDRRAAGGRAQKHLHARALWLPRAVWRSLGAVRQRCCTSLMLVLLSRPSDADTSPPRVASSSRHVTRHHTRPAGSENTNRHR